MSTDNMQRRISRRELLGMAARSAAFVGLSTLAAACAAPQAAPAPAPATTSGAGQATPAAAPKTGTVTTIQFITPAAVGLERTMYENFILKFQDENPDIKVNTSFEAWGDYMTKLPTILAGGVIPDMIHQHMSIVQDYAQKGALADLVPYMTKDNVKQDDYIPALFEAFSNKGKVYAMQKDSAAWGVYYNKDMFDKAKLPYPKDNWTMADFQQLASALTVDENGVPATDAKFDPSKIKQWGFAWMPDPVPTVQETARGFVKAYGSDWYSADGKQTLLTDPKTLQDLQMFVDMRCKQHSTPSAAQASAQSSQGDPFRQGLAAMIVGFHTVDFFSLQENVKFKYDVTYMPAGPGGQYVVVGASGWAVPAQAKNKDLGWRLVKYLTSLPVQTYIGQQKRWGVALRAAVDQIIPDDKKPEHFAMVHTNPLKGQTDRTVISMKFPPGQSKIQGFYSTNFDPIWTSCTGDLSQAAAATKKQVDDLLATMNW